MQKLTPFITAIFHIFTFKAQQTIIAPKVWHFLLRALYQRGTIWRAKSHESKVEQFLSEVLHIYFWKRGVFSTETIQKTFFTQKNLSHIELMTSKKDSYQSQTDFSSIDLDRELIVFRLKSKGTSKAAVHYGKF